MKRWATCWRRWARWTSGPRGWGSSTSGGTPAGWTWRWWGRQGGSLMFSRSSKVKWRADVDSSAHKDWARSELTVAWPGSWGFWSKLQSRPCPNNQEEWSEKMSISRLGVWISTQYINVCWCLTFSYFEKAVKKSPLECFHVCSMLLRNCICKHIFKYTTFKVSDITFQLLVHCRLCRFKRFQKWRQTVFSTLTSLTSIMTILKGNVASYIAI